MADLASSTTSKKTLPKARQKYVDKLFSSAKEAHVNAMTSASSVAIHNSMLLRQLEAKFATNPELDIAAEVRSESYAQTIESLREADMEKQSKHIPVF